MEPNRIPPGRSARRLAIGLVPISALAAALLATGQTAGRAQSGREALPNAATNRCAAMVGQSLGVATIDAAELVRAGTSLGKDLTGPIVAPADMCRIRATTSSGHDSTIKMEMWLPEHWNGKLLGTGGGGLNGGLGGAANLMSPAVGQGYAALTDDIGHDMGASAKWAFGHPEKIVDFGHRGDHLAAVAGKAIIAAFYQRPVGKSYFEGCSGGGREALMLAQRHPDDYDGIIAGAPAADFTGLMATAMWSAQRVRRMPEAAGLPAKLSLLRDAAVRKCDLLDGVADGIISKPSNCSFDPGELLCKPGAAPATCLSAGDVAAAREIYAGPKLAGGKQLVPGFSPGSEFDPVTRGWEPFITENGVGGTILGGEFFRWLVFQDPNWTGRSFQLDRDYATARARLGGIVDPVNPDLAAFTRRGGKLIIYHGWEDPVIPARATAKYYEAFRRRAGARAANSVRFFMLPGVGHCAGGHGPSVFDKVEMLDRWVAGAAAPDRLTVGKYDDDMAALAGKPAKLLQTRLVCAYPRIARYKGQGGVDKAESYVCAAPGARQRY